MTCPSSLHHKMFESGDESVPSNSGTCTLCFVRAACSDMYVHVFLMADRVYLV